MNKRLYNLFEKIDGRWICIGERALFKEAAIRHYQDRLIYSLSTKGGELRLRPVVTQKKED